MQLNDLVCALQYSKRLCELGVKEHSHFSWCSWENPLAGIYCEEDALRVNDFHISETRIASKAGADWVYPAYTAAELLEILPFSIENRNLFIYKNKHIPDQSDYYGVTYYKTSEDFVIQKQFIRLCDDNLANACAKLLIYLLENNLLKLEFEE